MVNAFKGEVLIEDGEGKKYTFVLGVFAQSAVEEEFGISWPEFWKRAKDWKTKDGFSLFCAGLALHHGDMGRREISMLMDRLGPQRCGEIITEAMEKGEGASKTNGAKQAQEDAKGADRPTPAKRQRRTAQPMPT